MEEIVYAQVFERDPATRKFRVLLTGVRGTEHERAVRNLEALERLMARHPRAWRHHRGNAFRQLRRGW